MADIRIKDLANTATSVPADAYEVIDSASGGTEKISRDNKRIDMAAAFVADPATYNLAPLSGGAVELAKGGTGATTVGTAKTNLQIPDIGTGANEVPLCGFLGSGAFRENDCIVTEHTSVGTDAGGVAVNFYANNTKLYCVKNGPVVSVTGRLMVQTTSATNQLRFTLPYVVGDFGNASGNGFASVGILDSSAGTYTAGYATFEEGNDYVQVRHTPEANDEYYISFTYHTNA